MNMSEDARSLKIAQGKKALEHLRSLKRNQNAKSADGDHDPLIVLPSPFMSRVSHPRERPRSVPADWLSSRSPKVNLDPPQIAKSVSGDSKQIGKTVLSDCTNTPASCHDQPSETTAPSSVVEEVILSIERDVEAKAVATQGQQIEANALDIKTGAKPQDAAHHCTTPAAAVPSPLEIKLEPTENSEQPPAPDAVKPMT
jgi:hypothetical protein